eukprot:m.162820 g.162820  ORF g.162820 m.162820 type:complete len:336 (-) comp12238_c0_seq1:602-1609(-)
MVCCSASGRCTVQLFFFEKWVRCIKACSSQASHGCKRSLVIILIRVVVIGVIVCTPLLCLATFLINRNVGHIRMHALFLLGLHLGHQVRQRHAHPRALAKPECRTNGCLGRRGDRVRVRRREKVKVNLVLHRAPGLELTNTVRRLLDLLLLTNTEHFLHEELQAHGQVDRLCAEDLDPLHLALGSTTHGVKVVLKFHLNAVINRVCSPAPHTLHLEFPFLATLVFKTELIVTKAHSALGAFCREGACCFTKALAAESLEVLCNLEKGLTVLLGTKLSKVVSHVIIDDNPALLNVGNGFNVDKVESNRVLVERCRNTLVPEGRPQHDLVFSRSSSK